MASIRKRKNGYQVQVRLKGHQAVTRTFGNLENAKRWARKTEAEIEANGIIARVDSKLTIAELLTRYLKEVTPRKRGRAQEERRLRRLLRDPISLVTLDRATPAVFSQFRDRRLKDGVRACSYDLVLLGHTFKTARIEWGIPLAENPLTYVRKPPNLPSRERRISPEEWNTMERAAAGCLNKLVWPLIVFAVETGMRRGEILSLEWRNVDFTRRTATLPQTKNGNPRVVPLTLRAAIVLLSLEASDGRAFPLTVYSVEQAWERLIKRARIANLRFHDLRHEAISRFFERGLTIAEVALISGHKDVRQLFRYTHLRAEDIARKLA